MQKTSSRADSTPAENVPKRTDVTLNEWVLLLRISGPRGSRAERTEWLRERYGLAAMQATAIVAHADDREAAEALTRSVPELRSVADRLLHEAQALGVDVHIETKLNSVPLIRRHEFAVVRAGRDKRLDLALALPGVPQTRRLIPVKKNGGTRFTHHIEISGAADLDAEVIGWLREAYELDS